MTPPPITFQLERDASFYGLTINNGEEPVFGEAQVPLPDGIRLVTMDRCGTIASDWNWSDRIYWPDVFAWSFLPHDDATIFCKKCEEAHVSKDINKDGLCGPCDLAAHMHHDDGKRASTRTIGNLRLQIKELQAENAKLKGDLEDARTVGSERASIVRYMRHMATLRPADALGLRVIASDVEALFHRDPELNPGEATP